ncbi:MAG TPA: hypothetical protein VGM75_37840 [Pseudonocardiaceae bacterium]|jgi:hypothetical protein
MSRDERIVIRIGGDMSGQFVLGDNNVTTNSAAALSGADRKLLTALFDEVGGQLDGQLEDHPDELAEPARAQLADLRVAVLATKPDVPAMVRVRDWFALHLPGMAAAIGRVVVHPILVRVVGAAGGSIAAEFQRHFGG